MNTLFLWDIDGTLIRAKGAGKRAMNKAFFEMFRIPDAFGDMQMAGGLDLHFIEPVFHKFQIDRTRLPDFLAAYYRSLEQEINTGCAELLPGVQEILQRIDQSASMFNAIGTGNLETGARIKLDAFRLNPFFPIGGFCESSVERYKVLQVGVERARAYYGIDFAPQQVVVVGDTVKDIEAARQIGAKVIAVATGGNCYEELAAANPDLLLYDLSEQDLFFTSL